MLRTLTQYLCISLLAAVSAFSQQLPLQTKWISQFHSYNASAGSMHVDANGYLILSGQFQGSVDVDPGVTVNTMTTAYISSFVGKYNASGGLVWARQFENVGSNQYMPLVATDPSRNVIIAGCFAGTIDIDPGPAQNIHVSKNYQPGGNGADFFIVKLDQAGFFVWGRVIGGKSMDMVTGIATDNTGEIYVSGTFADTVDFMPGSGTHTFASAGNSTDIFVMRLSAAGNVSWVRSMGGPSYETSYGICLDKDKNVISTGWLHGAGDYDPGPGVATLTVQGSWDTYLSKLDSSGNFVWAKKVGGMPNSEGTAVTTDEAGNVYMAGRTGGGDYDPGAAVKNVPCAGKDDVVVACYDRNGTYKWAGSFGGTDWDHPSIIKSSNGLVFVTGYFQDTADFDMQAGVRKRAAKGLQDAFLLVLDTTGAYRQLIHAGGHSMDLGTYIATHHGAVYWSGYFMDTCSIDDGHAISTLQTGAGEHMNIFLMKFEDMLYTSAEQEAPKRVILYPNPCRDVLHTGLRGTTFEVKSVLGQKILEQTVLNSDIATNELDAGIYFLYLDGRFIARFAKE